ncbi:pyridoxamine 5'-phosphate oxidase family protein [Pseudonocardia acaciae]|uniref:pyridoxamine 5'-phosphate oxidase family protein n=1 Tax=Pseudonocardia acaciae TaxID=551276 RepID=UPI000491DEBC|nr:TIGR03618 family F420-dependent PPOX class oxidoreductase [Pseudonocardia acaciae]
MNRRDQIRMSDEEIAAFLAEERTLIVASHGAGGHPHVVPMWFAMLDGKPAFWTYRTSQKVLNLRRDPRLSCLVEAGETYPELRGVSIEGTAEIVEDPDQTLHIGAAVAERFAGPLDDTAREGLRRSGAKRVAILVHPTKTVTWDHRKLPTSTY